MVRIKDDQNGGTVIELPKFKPSLVKVTISGAIILTFALNVFSWVWTASAKSKDIEYLKQFTVPLQAQVEMQKEDVAYNHRSIQENRRLMRALLKQLSLLCEKQGVEILYEAEDFFEDTAER